VRLAHRGQAVALVRLRVLLRADPEEAAVEQPHGAGEHALAGELVARLQVGGHAVAQRRQVLGEVEHLVELLGVAPGAPVRVVEVLLATGRVDAGGLDVAAVPRADPDVLPGRRDAEAADARDDVGLVDRVALLVEVGEPAAPLDALEPGA
jgi:hypothetical protein